MKSVIQELKQFAKDLSILVVEDDKILNQEIVSLANLFFKETHYAYDGAEAFQKYEKTKIDIVITDISMPKMDGVSLSSKIKSINPQQSIIVISAHRDIELLVKLVDIGIKQLVYKPFEHQELLYRLLRVCEDAVLTAQFEQFCEIDLSPPPPSFEQHKTDIKQIHTTARQPLYCTQDKAVLVLDDEHMTDIEDLIDLKDTLEDYVNLLVGRNASQEHVDVLSSTLLKIYTILSQMPLIGGMSVVIYELADFMQNIRYSSLSLEQKNELNMFEYIYEDISNYIESVFIKKNIINATYLEDSLRSSLTQLKRSIMADFDIDEDELELF